MPTHGAISNLANGLTRLREPSVSPLQPVTPSVAYWHHNRPISTA